MEDKSYTLTTFFEVKRTYDRSNYDIIKKVLSKKTSPKIIID